MLKFNVTDQRIELVEATPLGDTLVSDTVGEYICSFEFDPSWDGYVKTAVFMPTNISSCSDTFVNPIELQLLADDTCAIPSQVLIANTKLKIGIYGIKNDLQRPTLYSVPLLVRLGASPGENPVEPTPSVYEQILRIMIDTQAIAQSVRDDADAGKFDGAGVAPGGFPGQVLTKVSDVDYDTEWKSISGVSVSSWNGRVGEVVPENGDYSYQQITGLTEQLEEAKKGSTFVFKQKTPSDLWTIQHNLNKYPSVTIVDSAGTEVIGEVKYTDVNNLTARFSGGFSGTAYLN